MIKNFELESEICSLARGIDIISESIAEEYCEIKTMLTKNTTRIKESSLKMSEIICGVEGIMTCIDVLNNTLKDMIEKESKNPGTIDLGKMEHLHGIASAIHCLNNTILYKYKCNLFTNHMPICKFHEEMEDAIKKNYFKQGGDNNE